MSTTSSSSPPPLHAASSGDSQRTYSTDSSSTTPSAHETSSRESQLRALEQLSTTNLIHPALRPSPLLPPTSPLPRLQTPELPTPGACRPHPPPSQLLGRRRGRWREPGWFCFRCGGSSGDDAKGENAPAPYTPCASPASVAKCPAQRSRRFAHSEAPSSDESDPTPRAQEPPVRWPDTPHPEAQPWEQDDDACSPTSSSPPTPTSAGLNSVKSPLPYSREPALQDSGTFKVGNHAPRIAPMRPDWHQGARSAALEDDPAAAETERLDEEENGGTSMRAAATLVNDKTDTSSQQSLSDSPRSDSIQQLHPPPASASRPGSVAEVTTGPTGEGRGEAMTPGEAAPRFHHISRFREEFDDELDRARAERADYFANLPLEWKARDYHSDSSFHLSQKSGECVVN